MRTRATSRSFRSRVEQAIVGIVLLALLAISTDRCSPTAQSFDLGSFASSLFSLSIDDEKELGREFLQEIRKTVRLVDEPDLVEPVEAVGRDLLDAAGPQPFTYQFFVVADPTVNAFAGPAGLIFVHTGLLVRLDNVNELAAVMAHEITHAVDRHIAKSIAHQQKVTLPAMAAALAGALLARDSDVGQAIMAGSLAASASLMLEHSRETEDQADRSGLRLMARAGYDMQGMPQFFRKLMDEKRTNPLDVRPYLSTHPEVESRLTDMANLIPHVEQNLDMHPKAVVDLERLQARLIVETVGPEKAEARFRKTLETDPTDREARLGLAFALQQSGRIPDAITEMRRALDATPSDWAVHRDLGLLLYSRGRMQEAIGELEQARALNPAESVTTIDLAKVYLDATRVDDAVETLEGLVRREPANPEGQYQLGVAYGRKSEMGPAHAHLAIAFRLRGDTRNSRYHLDRAIEVYGPDSSRSKELMEEMKDLESEVPEIKPEPTPVPTQEPPSPDRFPRRPS